MKDKWLVTIEIETYDGNPKDWAWSLLLNGDEGKVIESQFKGRVLPANEEDSNE